MANKKKSNPFLLCNFIELNGSVHQLIVGNEIFSTGEGPGWRHKPTGWLLKQFTLKCPQQRHVRSCWAAPLTSITQPYYSSLPFVTRQTVSLDTQMEMETWSKQYPLFFRRLGLIWVLLNSSNEYKIRTGTCRHYTCAALSCLCRDAICYVPQLLASCTLGYSRLSLC